LLLNMTFAPRCSKCELWCGQSGGSISVFVLGDGIVSSQDYVNHYEPPLAGLEVLQMVATDDLPIESTIDVFDYEDDGCAGGGGDGGGGGGGGDGAVSGPVVWSYVYPGCVVYRWDPLTRRVLHRLDCSKLAPCSESLQSISIEEHLSPGRCQVAASEKDPFSCVAAVFISLQISNILTYPVITQGLRPFLVAALDKL